MNSWVRLTDNPKVSSAGGRLCAEVKMLIKTAVVVINFLILEERLKLWFPIKYEKKRSSGELSILLIDHWLN